MIKLVVSDMDGTLINNDSKISHRNLKAIHELRKRHIEFAIASGRDYHSVFEIMKQYDIKCESILGNGAQYCDKEGNILMSCYMDKSIVKDVVSLFEERNICYMIFTTNGFYTGQDPDYVRNCFIERGKRRFHSTREDYEPGGKNAMAACNYLEKIDDYDEFLQRDMNIIKVEAFSLRQEEIPLVKELLKTIPSIAYLSSFDDNVEVTDQNAQKGLILEKVLLKKGLVKDEVIVLGDGMNDITLFECFPYSFAPENANETIKKLAFQVVKDCEEDGFSEAIEFMLKELNKE